MENYKGWVSHMEFLIILFTLIGGIYVQDGKLERQGERFSNRIDNQYNMFVTIQHEIKEISNEIKDLSIKSALIEERSKK